MGSIVGLKLTADTFIQSTADVTGKLLLDHKKVFLLHEAPVINNMLLLVILWSLPPYTDVLLAVLTHMLDRVFVGSNLFNPILSSSTSFLTLDHVFHLSSPLPVALQHSTELDTFYLEYIHQWYVNI